MKKKQLLSALALSTIVLAQAGFVSAEEVTPADPSQPATEVVVPNDPGTPVEPTQPEVPVEPTTPIETPGDPSIPEPTEPTTPPTTDDSNQLDVTPETPQSEEKPDVSDQPATDRPVKQPEATQPEQPTEEKVSPSTGQVISTVSSEAPIETNTGVSVVSTKKGKVILSDGSEVAPEEIGAKTNDDKTITVTKKDGSKVTLPHTGEAKTLGLSLLGAIVALAGALFWKKKKVHDN